MAKGVTYSTHHLFCMIVRMSPLTSMTLARGYSGLLAILSGGDGMVAVVQEGITSCRTIGLKNFNIVYNGSGNGMKTIM